MAMLAEPRRKQKWGLNPRGTLWADDQNKFGQKLMEKMGWNKGEGLGKEGQGITEHIKVAHKDNTKGVGYKGKDDEWVKHVDAFENVLAALNSENNSTDNSPNNSPNNSASNSPANSDNEDEETKSRRSLEKRSKESRARVHYHKFTRGKDLSNYKEDDLACILGSKKSKRKNSMDNIEPKEEPVLKDFFGDEVGTTKKEHGVVTIAGGNYQEYFAKKMAALKKQREGNENNEKVEDKEESNLPTNEDALVETKKSKKKKKKDKNQLDISLNDSNIDENEENSSTTENVEKKHKKKKYKTNNSDPNVMAEPDIKEDNTPLFGFEFSCGFTNGSTIKKYPLNKHNIFSNEDDAEDEKNVNENISKDEPNEPISSENIKKKKHKKDLESSQENVEIKEKKKKKKSKDISNEIDTTDISKNKDSENDLEEVKRKKKKRCKNKNQEKNNVDIEDKFDAESELKEKVKKNESIEEPVLIECLPENSELKKQKKKKNKEKTGNGSLIIEEVSPKTKIDLEGNVVESQKKEKQKSKKRKREEEEDDNENSNPKKIKKITEDDSIKASPGKNELKRREYWKKRTEEMARHKEALRKKKKSKKEKTRLKPEDKNDLANKIITTFEGAEVPNIISKRDKKKMESSRVP